jgi:putative transferase (TIGR04331 family)
VHLVERPVSLLENKSGAGQIIFQQDKREVLRGMAENVGWSLARLAFSWLPSFYVEEFESRYSRVRVIGPEQKQFHASYLSSVDDRFIIARYVEEGAGLNIYQHAAMYGEVDEYLLHYAETGIADRFYTWGWKVRDNDVPFLALRLIKPKHDQFEIFDNADTWLYINIRQPFAWNIQQTLEIQERLIRRLHASKRRKIVIRPRVNKGGNDKEQVSEVIVRAIGGVDSGKTNIARLVGHAELVIVDLFPTTIFMECLVSGKPVIAIVPATTRFTPLAEMYYHEFFEIGLLQKSPEAAAEFLNHVNLRSWWRHVMENELIKAYMDSFCRIDSP